MTQLTKTDLKNEFFQNNKILAKEKSKIARLLKVSDKDKSCTSDTTKVCEILNERKALTERQRDIVKALVMMGEDKKDYMDHSLFEYVKDGDCTAIAFVLLDGAEIDVKDKDMWTPLHIAALNGHEQMVDLFLRMGANPESKNHMGRMPIHLAVSHNQVKVVELFLAKGFNPFAYSKDNRYPMDFTTSQEMIALLEKYEEKFIKQNINNPETLRKSCSSILFRAVSRKYHSVLPDLAKLQKNGEDIGVATKDEKGNTVLHLAVKNNDMKTLELLFPCRPYPFTKNADGKFPIQLAQSPEIKSKMAAYEENYIRWVIGDPAYVKQMGNELLLYCAEKGYPDAVQDLLKFTAEKLVDIDTSNADDDTPLHIAVKNGHEAVVAVLLRGGAELLVINKKDLMPVDYVKGNKQLERIFNNYERIWVNRILQKVVNKKQPEKQPEK